MTDLQELLGEGGLGSPEAMDEAVAKVSRGDAPAPPEGDQPNQVTLMRGLEDTTSRIAEVRELNGYDEEILARFQFGSGVQSTVVGQLNRVAELATVSIGGNRPTMENIESLLVGDRNMLVMAIRRLTYGAGVDGSMSCPSCLETNEVTIDPFTDLEFVPWSGDMFRDVEIRNGRRAKVRLMLAGDQSAAFEDPDDNVAERNSIFLERMVMDLDGRPVQITPSVAAQTVRSLGIVDRNSVLESMVRQPGYQFGEEVEGRCASCNNNLGLKLDVADLLRG